MLSFCYLIFTYTVKTVTFCPDTTSIVLKEFVICPPLYALLFIVEKYEHGITILSGSSILYIAITLYVSIGKSEKYIFPFGDVSFVSVRNIYLLLFSRFISSNKSSILLFLCLDIQRYSIYRQHQRKLILVTLV